MSALRDSPCERRRKVIRRPRSMLLKIACALAVLGSSLAQIHAQAAEAPRISPVRERIMALAAGKEAGNATGKKAAFVVACEVLAKPTGQSAVTYEELKAVNASLAEIAKQDLSGDKVLQEFVQAKLAEIGKASTQEPAVRGSEYEFLRPLEKTFGDGVSLEAVLRSSYMAELAARYGEQQEFSKELALVCAMRDLTWDHRWSHFCLTREMVRIALAMGDVSLARSIACEYFARFRCELMDGNQEYILFADIAKHAGSAGDSATAFQCARLALAMGGVPKGDAVRLWRVFAYLGPGIGCVLAEPWPSKDGKGERWFDKVSEAWRAVPALPDTPDLAKFAEDGLQRAVESKSSRMAVARMQMLLGREKATVEALIPPDGKPLPDEDWRFLCRLLLLVSGDPRVLDPASAQIEKLGLDPGVAERLRRTLKANPQQSEYVASLREEFMGGALRGTMTALQDVADSVPRGHILALFFEHASQGVESGDTAGAVTALKAMTMTDSFREIAARKGGRQGETPAPDVGEKRAVLAWFLGEVPGGPYAEAIVDEMMTTFPEETPEARAREFLRYAQLYKQGKYVGQCRFYAAHYLYRNARYGETLAVLRDCEATDVRRHLLEGLCYVKTNNMQKAKGALEVVLGKFPDSPQAEQALFLMGWCDLTAGSKAKAAETFKKLIEKYPTGTYAEKARKFLENLEPAGQQ